MRRALVITYYWPPTGGSGVQRWVKFAKHMPEFGWQPVIYTPENPEQIAVDDSLLVNIPEQAEVIKRRILEPYALARNILGGSGEKGAGVNPVNKQEKSLKQKIALWVRGNFFVPDPRVWWVRPSVRFLRNYLKRHPVDVIVSTGPPQSMHLIGLELHKITGIPWVADFRDPWTELFYFKHLGLSSRVERKHRQMEQEVLDRASAVVAVTPMVQADFQNVTNTPVHLISNGFDEDDFGLAAGGSGSSAGKHTTVGKDSATGASSATGSGSSRTKRTDTKFRIVHTGLFASDGNPLALWDAIAALPFKNRIDIRLAGKVDAEIVEAIKDAGLEPNLSLLGYISHDDSVQELKNADMLILPLRQEPEYKKVLPGKIFEYLASLKPVLGIGQEDGAAAQLLHESNAGIMLDWPRGEAMADFICKVRNGEFKALGTGIEKYSRRNLTKKMIDLFEQL